MLLLQAHVYNVEGVVMPGGTRGRCSDHVVCWRYPHSAWPVIFARIAAIAGHAAAHGAVNIGFDALAEGAAALGLLGQMLRCWDGLMRSMAEHVEVRLHTAPCAACGSLYR